MRRMQLLEAVEWAEREFGSLTTGGDVTLRDMRRAEDAGLVRRSGFVAVCDDDGGPREPERYRMGWKLTHAGRAIVEVARRAEVLGA